MILRSIVKVDSRKQTIFHVLGSILILSLLVSIYIGAFLAVSVVFVLLALSPFVPNVINMIGERRNTIFAKVEDAQLILKSPANLWKKDLTIDVRNVDHVVEWGRRGKRHFEFSLKNGGKIQLNLERFLGLSFTQDVEAEFIALLKEVFGDVERVYR